MNTILATTLSLTVLSGLGAQALQPAPAWEDSPNADGVFTTRIEAKLAEGTGAVLVDGALRSRRGQDFTAVANIFDRGTAERLIPLPLATLDRWHTEASQGDGEKPGHLALWFRITGETPAATAAILRALRAQPLVQTAYLEGKPELPGGSDIPPKTPLWESSQGYAGPPPNGVHSDPAHTLVGGRGRDVKITDMEVYWTGEHEDLSVMDAPDVWLGDKHIRSSGDHGTAVVGELAADRNAYGVRGISDMAKIHVSSWNNGGVAAAISAGVNVARRGDMVLLEVHYRTSVGFMPAEAFASNYNVILTATRRGVHICEAAGNGNVNLNTVAFGGPAGYLDPNSPNFRDSGAIMIGATNGSATARAGFSNYGRRITANGWGYNVYTTGYTTLFHPNSDIRQRYTKSFSGTSSASPIVTATVACLSGAVKYQDERILTVNEVRNLLRAHGTPCTGQIGNRPDLKAMLNAVGLPDGLEQSRESYSVGQDYEVKMTNAPGSGTMALFISDSLSKLDIGLNRKFHLGFGAMRTVGIFRLPGSLKVTIPNIAAIKDKDFYFQGISAGPNGRLHVTSSTQAYVR